MAKISPFTALRYNTAMAGDIQTLCCPPYDVISPERQAALKSQNPYNAIHLELPSGEDRYRRAGALLRAWWQNGILKRDEISSYYVYRLDFNDGQPRNLYGFFARASLEPFDKGIILPHEETLSKDKTDRYLLLQETLCNISPIYGLYEERDGAIEQALQAAMNAAPDISFTDDDMVTHSLWPMKNPGALEMITRALSDKRVLIADGHHRYETALDFYQEQKQKTPALPADSPLGTILMFLVDMYHQDLVVWPTHRLIRGLPDFSERALTVSLSRDFDMETCPADAHTPARLAEMPNTVGLYTGGDTVTLLRSKEPDAVLRALPEKSAAYRALEVSLLHACILEPYLGIDKEKLAGQTHLVYTRDLGEVYEKVRDGDFQCAFLLPATPVSMIGRVADMGERMPQKSTYFYPKLTTGLIFHPLKD